jgi:hypothetical protein
MRVHVTWCVTYSIIQASVTGSYFSGKNEFLAGFHTSKVFSLSKNAIRDDVT